MIDRIFGAALVFCLLAGGTAATISTWFDEPAARPAVATIQLERVVITGQRIAADTPLAEAGATQPAAARVQ